MQAVALCHGPWAMASPCKYELYTPAPRHLVRLSEKLRHVILTTSLVTSRFLLPYLITYMMVMVTKIHEKPLQFYIGGPPKRPQNVQSWDSRVRQRSTKLQLSSCSLPLAAKAREKNYKTSPGYNITRAKRFQRGVHWPTRGWDRSSAARADAWRWRRTSWKRKKKTQESLVRQQTEQARA
jgi:hypothetical protein